MTYLEFMQTYDPKIDSELAEFILWEETCFPMGDLKTITQQIRSSIRAGKNKIKRCWACSYKKPYHMKNCPSL